MNGRLFDENKFFPFKKLFSAGTDLHIKYSLNINFKRHSAQANLVVQRSVIYVWFSN